MKRNIIRVVCIILIIVEMPLLFTSKASQSKEYSWFIKRNGNSAPAFPPEAEDLRQYNTYYLDLKANEDNRVLYLTFDAGYSNPNLEKILDVLKKEGVPAAFFLLDHIIIKNTDVVNRMINDGHTVGNHTLRHRNLCNAKSSEIESDLSALESVFRERCGKEMSKYFRFPEGKYSIESLKTVCSLGYKTVFWSFGYEDWDNNRQPDRKYALKKILRNTHNGAVFLFHPTSKTNADIMEELILAWKSAGYRFGTLDELCK